MARFLSFWRNLLRRDRVERDLDDEVRATLEILVEEKMRAGMTRGDARRAAGIEIGSSESVKQQVRETRSGALIETLLQDLRYGLRVLVRAPLFSLTAVLSLAIGIGATTAMFTVANGLLLRAVSGVEDAGQLVDIVRTRSDRGGDPGIDPISYPDYLDIRERVQQVSDVYAYQLEVQTASVRLGRVAEPTFVNRVSMNYFTALGVRAAAGRLFGGGDGETPGESPLLVLSHRFWTRRLQSDPSIVGRTIRLNGIPLTVVGVAAAGFNGTGVVAPDMWVPVTMTGVFGSAPGAGDLSNRYGSWLMAGARLRPGVSRAQASADVRRIGDALNREYPLPSYMGPPDLPQPLTFDWSVERASPVPSGLRLIAGALVTLLLAIVSLVLAIACANVAGILLARAATRRREIGVRTAIGAGRARIVRQLLTETVLLFTFGGVAGLALAQLLTSAIVLLLPAFPIPVNLSTPLDIRVVAFSMTISFIAALLCGLVPALEASKADVVSALKEESHRPPDRARLRHAFVVAQVAFSALLVVLAGVFLRGLDNVTTFDRGFDATDVDVATVDLAMAGYTETTGPAFARDLIAGVRRLPGVERATLADQMPGPGAMSFGAVTVPGVTPPNGAQYFYPTWKMVDPGYFSTLRIPVVAGREFTDADRAGSEPVAIVTATTARRLWPERDPIGQMLLTYNASPSAPSAAPAIPVRVIGVARDLPRPRASTREGVLELYVPWQQRYRPQLAIFVRRSGERSLAGEVRALISRMNPDLAVLTAETLDAQMTGPVEVQLRIGAGVAASVGLVGLLLAGLGVYGVTAHAVAARTREIGIRLSLGAGTKGIITLVLRQGMLLVGFGAVIGLVLGAAAGQLLSMRLAVPPPDAALLAIAAVLFTAIGLAACYVPVRRATRIHATEALRYE
jgi:predicted permease